MRLRFAIVATAIVGSAVAGFGQGSSAAKELRIQLDRRVNGWLKAHDVPSVAVAYVENGRLAWTAVYGEQSPGIAASARTIYNVASLAKPVAAELALRLASKGKIGLDEPMAAYWVDPDVASNPWHKLLTPRICLTHETGFPNWRYQTKNVLEFQSQPGTKMGYSGEGFDYLGRFLEKKLGRPFEDLAQSYVFDPIGMTETAFTDRRWQAGRIAVAHGFTGKSPDTKAPAKWTAADLLHTTIGDYARFVVAVMGDQRISKPIAAERRRMTRNIAMPEDVARICSAAKMTGCRATAGMGLGWEVMELNGETVIRHQGSDRGVRTAAVFFPAKKSGAVVFTNGEAGGKVIREVVGLLCPNALLVQIL